MALPARATQAPQTARAPAASMTVLVNPHAGAAGAGDIRERIERLFSDAGGIADVELLERGTDVAARAREHARDGAVVVAAGGDGTVSAVAAAVIANGGTLGVLPLGTLNHFAKDLGSPIDPAKAADTIINGRVAHVDVGEVNGRVFLNNSSLGLYPRLLSEREAERRRGHHKWVAFSIAALRIWRAYSPVVVHLTIDGVETVVDTPFVFVGNNAYQASGLGLGGRTSLTQGVLSLYAAPACRRFDVIRLVGRALVTGLEGDARFDAWQLQSARVETARHSLSVAVDGELVTLAPPLRYRTRPGALRVMVPDA